MSPRLQEAADPAVDLELLAHYLASADEKVSALEACLRAAREGPESRERSEELRRALHKIAGSAGTYGFPALTETARRLEREIIAARAAPRLPETLFAAVAAFCGEMASAFASARSQLGAAPSATRERLVIAVIGEGDGAFAAGEALASAGVHLLAAGASAALLGFRGGGAHGLAIGLVEADREAAPAEVDLPIRVPSAEVRNAIAAGSAHGALLLSAGAEERAFAEVFSRAGKPVVELGAGKGPLRGAPDPAAAVAALLAMLSAARR